MLFSNSFSLVFIYLYIYIISWLISCCDLVSAVVQCCCGFVQAYTKSSFCFHSLSIFMEMVVGLSLWYCILIL